MNRKKCSDEDMLQSEETGLVHKEYLKVFFELEKFSFEALSEIKAKAEAYDQLTHGIKKVLKEFL